MLRISRNQIIEDSNPEVEQHSIETLKNKVIRAFQKEVWDGTPVVVHAYTERLGEGEVIELVATIDVHCARFEDADLYDTVYVDNFPYRGPRYEVHRILDSGDMECLVFERINQNMWRRVR